MTSDNTSSSGSILARHGRYLAAFLVPYVLREPSDDKEQLLKDVYTSASLLANAIAGSGPTGSSIQLRFLSQGKHPTGTAHFRCAIVLGADTNDELSILIGIVKATAPMHYPLVPANARNLEMILRWGDEGTSPASFAKVTRKPVPLSLDAFDENIDELLVVEEFTPQRADIARALTALSQQPGKSTLLLEISPHNPSSTYREHLQEAFQISLQRSRNSSLFDASRQRTVTSFLRNQLNEVSRTMIRANVALSVEGDFLPGILEVVSAAIIGSPHYNVARTSSPVDRVDARRQFEDLDTVLWGSSSDGFTDEIASTFTISEASRFFQLLVTPEAGIPGLMALPPTRLPQSPQLPPDHAQGQSPRVIIGASPSGRNVDLTLSELNKHTLIVGLPGFGKTNTVHILLQSLWNDHGVPFLVLDPVKTDYREIGGTLAPRNGINPLYISLGPDTPGFNPFSVPTGVSIASHASRLVGAFDAALRISERFPLGLTFLSRAVFKSYAESADEFPTLRTLVKTLKSMLATETMSEESRANFDASLLGRLRSMVEGPLGQVLLGEPDQGVDWDEILRRPTVIEFRRFAGPSERSLIFGLLVAGLISVREANALGHNRGLQHVTVLEEAHRVLASTEGVVSEGSRLMAEAIAELRGSGEGFIVVDQTPTALDPLVRKVCGSVVVHRLIDDEERESAGSTLALSEAQRQDISRLDVGQVLVYGAARQAPVLTKANSADTMPFNGIPNSSLYRKSST